MTTKQNERQKNRQKDKRKTVGEERRKEAEEKKAGCVGGSKKYGKLMAI